MKRRKVRGTWTVLMSLLLVAASVLGGCGKKEGASSNKVMSEDAKKYVYKVEEKKFDGIDANTINQVFYFEDKIGVMGCRWEYVDVEAPAVTETGEQAEETIQPRDVEDNGEEATAEEEITTETGETGEEAESTDEEAEASAVEAAMEEDPMFAAEMGEGVYQESRQYNFFATYDYEGKQLSYTESEGDSDIWYGRVEQAVGEEAIYLIEEQYTEEGSNTSLLKIKPDGTEVWRVPMTEYGENVWVDSLACDKDGRILLYINGDERLLLILDKDSNLVKKLAIEDENLSSIMVSDNGKVMATSWGDTAQTIKEINLETGELSEAYKVPGNSYNYSYYPGYGFDLYLVGNNALYGYNLGEEEITKLMDFIDSDLESTNIFNIHPISDTQFYACYYPMMGDGQVFGMFTKVNPADVKDKTVLTLACNYADYTVTEQVIKFNKNNDTYRIQIKDYSVYNTEEDYTQSYTRLNADIVAGNIPDILQVSFGIPVDSYISKGLFEDLYPYIDADEEYNRDSLVMNIMDTFSVDGKLYQLIPSVSVITVAAKTADVGEERGWTLDDLNALAASKPEGTEIFADTIRSSILQSCIQMSGEQFINWETGECSFDSEGFVKFLEFVKQFPEEWQERDESYWNNYESMYREGRTLLQQEYISGFSDFNRIEKGTFGEPVTMIGFPSENKNGSAFDWNMNFAISAKSANKDGAWEFLRYFLSYEYQKDMWGIPLNLQCYEEMKEKAMQKPYYMDENNKKVEYDETYYIDGVEIVIPPMTKEEVQEAEDFIFSINQVSAYNESLNNIIMEEAEGFFAGQKSAKEVADIIQSRAKIYVNENR